MVTGYWYLFQLLGFLFISFVAFSQTEKTFCSLRNKIFNLSIVEFIILLLWLECITAKSFLNWSHKYVLLYVTLNFIFCLSPLCPNPFRMRITLPLHYLLTSWFFPHWFAMTPMWYVRRTYLYMQVCFWAVSIERFVSPLASITLFNLIIFIITLDIC